ncbi:MAG: nucleotidyltransferase [Bacteroidales bacterium]|nr:nucleotidyltransferase [Bacteroidales bacterium]MBO7255930.1 nucleotidyltransferase [Bacteroidales bacterium]
MKPTLVVLAAGMGSRYGSLKQMDGVGPNNEAIIDYSIYDAVQAGFGKVVFVIRHSFEQEFREVFSKEHFGGKIDVEFVFQELDYLPEGFTVPEGRIKPWGTCHAVMMAAPVVDGPFAVINADDFYGREAYITLAEYLRQVEGTQGNYSMVGYNLRNTLSDYGTVSRGECSVDENDNLVSIVERTAIERGTDGIVRYKDENGEHPIDENTTVSMNLFGFTPDFFSKTEELFKEFLSNPANMSNLKSEFFIPLCVNTLINQKRVSLKVLTSEAKWFGVTYKEDKPEVVSKISKLIADGIYPSKLW